MIAYKLSIHSDYAQKFVGGLATGEWHNTQSSEEYLKWLEEGNTPEPADEQAQQ